jgi:hypothetical protein
MAALFDSMLRACQRHDMANLQVKGVPDTLYRQIRREAAREGQTIGGYVLEAVRAKLARQAFHARLARRRPVDLGRPAAAALDEVRSERDRQLGR